MRIAVEESGHQDYKFSSTGYEPNDYFFTETCVENKKESVTEQRFPKAWTTTTPLSVRRCSTRTEDESITLKEKACRPVCRRRQWVMIERWNPLFAVT